VAGRQRGRWRGWHPRQRRRFRGVDAVIVLDVLIWEFYFLGRWFHRVDAVISKADTCFSVIFGLVFVRWMCIRRSRLSGSPLSLPFYIGIDGWHSWLAYKKLSSASAPN
jgi:hypothetical protein